MQSPTLTALDRIGLQQVVRDAGFDLMADRPDGLEASSTHAPLRIWVVRPPQATSGWWLGLSMPQVATLLEGEPVHEAPLVQGADAWIAFPSRHALDSALVRAWRLSRTLPDTLEQRWKQRLRKLGDTEREATVRQRVGQDLFREGLLEFWKGRCAITGLDEPALLRASHAKPWAACSDAERLDVYNGLLLAAHWDAAFDTGLVGVTQKGEIVLSNRLSAGARALFEARAEQEIFLRPEHLPYLAWHLDNVFR